jgi:hypothetical protein
MAIPTPDEIPSNSQKSQQNQQPEKPPLPQFGGVGGVKRKQPNKFWAWMRKMFLSDRKPKDIMKDIVENQIVPGVKDNFRNSFVSSLDMFIYQGARTTAQSNTSNHVSYNSMYKTQQANKMVRTSAPSTNNQQQQEESQNGFSNPTFARRSNPDPKNIGAEQFLAAMKEREFPTFSVMDLYSMRGQSISWTWDVWGWTREEIQNVQIVHINNPDKPWMIDLPPAHLINN